MLSSGSVSEDVFWLLIEISTIRSEKLIKALYDYLVLGSSRKAICETYDVNNGYFSTTLHRIQRVNQIVSELIPFYMGKHIVCK
ncbi:TPA: transcriptional regulator [Escherichia coli]|nr:transcriptional regulator [Escherichia coli]